MDFILKKDKGTEIKEIHDECRVCGCTIGNCLSIPLKKTKFKCHNIDFPHVIFDAKIFNISICKSCLEKLSELK